MKKNFKSKNKKIFGMVKVIPHFPQPLSNIFSIEVTLFIYEVKLNFKKLVNIDNKLLVTMIFYYKISHSNNIIMSKQSNLELRKIRNTSIV